MVIPPKIYIYNYIYIHKIVKIVMSPTVFDKGNQWFSPLDLILKKPGMDDA